MMQLLRRALGVGLLLLAAVWATPAAYAQDPSGQLEVRFLDVGQADAILVRCPDGSHYLLIDSGDTRYPGSSKAFRQALLDEFRDRPKKLALVVASHPHADHIGSMQWVLETFDVEVYVDNGQKFDSALWAKLDKVRRRQVSDAEITYVAGKKTGFADLAFCPQVGVRLLVPWAVRELSNTNDRSVVVSLTYGKTSFLFGGDAEEHAEEVMVNDFEPGEREHLRVMVLKAGHHGSDTSSTLPFIAAVNPKTVVVSSGKKEVGTNARYKHPRHSTMQNYNNWLRNHDEGEPSSQPGRVWAYDKPGKRWRQIERRRGLWVTPEDGTVVMLSDGEKIEIRTEKTGAQVSVSP